MENIFFKILSFFLLLPNIVFAQTETATGIQKAIPMVNSVAKDTYNTNQSLELILGDIVLTILSLIGIIFVIFMIYAGYLWMTASGNEQKVDKSKEILRQAIIGLIVVVGAYAISYFVIQIFSPQLKAQ